MIFYGLESPAAYLSTKQSGLLPRLEVYWPARHSRATLQLSIAPHDYRGKIRQKLRAEHSLRNRCFIDCINVDRITCNLSTHYTYINIYICTFVQHHLDNGPETIFVVLLFFPHRQSKSAYFEPSFIRECLTTPFSSIKRKVYSLRFK